MAANAAHYYTRAFADHPIEFDIRTADCSDAEDSTLLTPPPYSSVYAPFQNGCFSLQPEDHNLVAEHYPPSYLSYDNSGHFYHQLPDHIWVPSSDYSSHTTAHPSAPVLAVDEGDLVYPPEHIPIHAPVPVPSGFSLLSSPARLCEQSSISEPQPPAAQSTDDLPCQKIPGHLSVLPRIQGVSSRVDLVDPVIPINFNTFPTPSELLTDLTAREAAAQAHTELPEPAGGPKVETQRKARQRAVAESVGFAPTDPDTISSHDKKRHYLECLEQYVLYLHEQFRLLGQEPVSLERVSTYRGLSSRSIRTLLVHMQEQLRKHHDRTLEEEQNFTCIEFADLRDALLAQESGTAVQQLRRYSVP